MILQLEELPFYKGGTKKRQERATGDILFAWFVR